MNFQITNFNNLNFKKKVANLELIAESKEIVTSLDKKEEIY